MLQSTLRQEILELRLNRPPVNALDPALVQALHAAFLQAPASGARAIVLCGSPGLFSAGLDVPALLARDAPGMRTFWKNFTALLAAIGRCPLPCAAALTGHSPAGGTVLSLFCDYRVLAQGPFKMGLNEVQVGLSVPAFIQAALCRVVGAHRAERLVVSGTMLTSEEALGAGMVDVLCAPEDVCARAHAWCAQLLALPHEAMSETRRLARADLHALLDAAEADGGEEFLHRWFSRECQVALHALVAKLKGK